MKSMKNKMLPRRSRGMLRGYLNFLMPFFVKELIFFLRPSKVLISSSSFDHLTNSLFTHAMTFVALSSEREFALIIFLEILFVKVLTYLCSLVRVDIAASLPVNGLKITLMKIKIWD